MYFNNTVYGPRGNIIGFRCRECGGIRDRMWGNVCNDCREKERRHQELIAAIKERGMSHDSKTSRDRS